MQLGSLLFIVTFLFTGCASTPSADDSDARLVFESTSNPPKHFRSWPELSASGSGPFTPAALAGIAARVKGPVTVVDLRSEPHGFVNSEPVAWISSSSSDLGHNDALERETTLLGSVRGEESVGRSVASDGGSTATPTSVNVVSVLSEREVVEAAGHRYRRLAINENRPPDDEEVERFVRLVRALPPGSWVHFHCNDGGRRTTDFLTMYDIIRNAGRVSFDSIRNRHLFQGREVARAGSDREEFLRRFYAYARTHPDGSGRGWRVWLTTSK